MERALGGQRVDRRLLFAPIAQQTVRRVLDEQEPVLFGQRGDAPPLRARAGRASRVLEIGDDVEELRRVLGERRFQGLEVRAVRFERDADHRRLMAAQERQGAVVGRRLDEHHVARLQQVQAQELDQLQRAVAGQHPIDAHALPSGEPFPQRLKAERRAVLHHRRAVAGERGARRIDDFLDRERVVRGHAAGEVDDGRLLGHSGAWTAFTGVGVLCR